MKSESNKFGKGDLYEATDLIGPVYCLCCACMSIYSEFLTWANQKEHGYIGCQSVMTPDPASAKTIIVLSCQVTDIAILNDIRSLEKLMEEHGDSTEYYVGGCLARRFDIELPEGVKRLDNIRADNQKIHDKTLVEYAPPFWVKDFSETDNEFNQGNLFRKMYPLRISVGCNKKCKYCTIRTTRGKPYELPIVSCVQEFIDNEDVVLTADSPSSELLRSWIHLSHALQKPLSIRNVEPQVTRTIRSDLVELANHGLLKVYHCPIQSHDERTLKAMGRVVDATMWFAFNFVYSLKSRGVFVATNVIVDYELFPNPDMDLLNKQFDYVSWNPYWDGKWDRSKAEERYRQYIE